ncbi:MAG: hypothetical protein Q8R02_22580 [Hyphomonadaceae bacterium]|nr:hypothetical protein [Hyphomonadaceae bacterium]
MTMMPADDFFRTLQLVRKAKRRGDAAAARHWMQVAEGYMRVAGRFNDILDKGDVREAAAARASGRPSRERKPDWFLAMKREERNR